MSLMDDIKAKADDNGDGKLSIDDLEDLRGRVPDDKLDELKAKADQSGDGKVDLQDVKNFDLGGSVDDLKDKAGGLFGK